jgi:hypothetical protein
MTVPTHTEHSWRTYALLVTYKLTLRTQAQKHKISHLWTWVYQCVHTYISSKLMTFPTQTIHTQHSWRTYALLVTYQQTPHTQAQRTDRRRSLPQTPSQFDHLRLSGTGTLLMCTSLCLHLLCRHVRNQLIYSHSLFKPLMCSHSLLNQPMNSHSLFITAVEGNESSIRSNFSQPQYNMYICTCIHNMYMCM